MSLQENTDVQGRRGGRIQNLRVDPDHAHKICYVLGDVLVADLRLTLGWAESPGFWGVMWSAAEHAHCYATSTDAVVLPEGAGMMSHIRINEPWERGKPIRVPREAAVRPARGGGLLDPSFPRYMSTTIH